MAKSPFKSLDPAVRLPPRHSRSPRSSSRSPERRAHFLSHQLDPLLSDLSPETTLQVLSATDVIPINKNTPHSLLAKSISDVSTVDRAFGIRAAVAAQKLNEWHTEVLSWLWPDAAHNPDTRNGFLPPKELVESSGKDSDQAKAGESEREIHFGSLPASILKLYQNRIKEIKDGMEALDVEELKEHVLTAHIPSRSRPLSSASNISTSSSLASYLKMSDFTAVITATILRALPVLSRLNNLLSNWHARLLVLNHVPGLLLGLQETKRAIDNALNRLQNGLLPKLDDPSFSRESFRSSWRELRAMVSSLGRRIDSMLDILEGREDSLPDSWIDDMEAIESRFATWAFEAERRAVQNELRCLYQRELDEYLAQKASKESARDASHAQQQKSPPYHDVTEATVEHHTASPSTTSSLQFTPLTPQPLLPAIKENQTAESRTSTPFTTPSSEGYTPDNTPSRSQDPIKRLGNTPSSTPRDVRAAAITKNLQDYDIPNFESPSGPHPSVYDGTRSEDPMARPVSRLDFNDIDSPCSDSRSDVSPDNSPAPLTPLANMRKRSSKRESNVPSRLQLIPSGSDATIKQNDVADPAGSPDASTFIPDKESLDLNTVPPLRSPTTPAQISSSPGLSSSGSVIHHTPEAAKNSASRFTSSASSSPDIQTPPSLRSFGRTMSLPLARYINDESAVLYGQDGVYHPNSRSQIGTRSIESVDMSPKGQLGDSVFDRRNSLTPGTSTRSELRRSVSSASISSSPRLQEQLSLRRLSNFSRLSNLRRSASSEPLYLEKSSLSTGSPDTNISSTPLKPLNLPSRLSPFVRSSSPEAENTFPDAESLELIPPPLKPRTHSGTKTPVKIPLDEFDDRVHSILDTIPKIRMKSTVGDDSNERPGPDNLRVPTNSGRTHPPSPTLSRSSTPTPSLTLTPAPRPRRRNNPGPDEVRLYHLHRGGKAAPVKLFVRIVGETGERVMVRVGGGWADLGEYLREYAMHHGRRGIIDGRFEVQGIPVVSQHPRAPTPTPTNGRTTPIPPSRPGSAMDTRPGSSLAIRRARRATGSGADLLPNLTAANIQRLSEEGVSPGNSSVLSSQRRPSLSSATSMSTSVVGDHSFSATPSRRSFSTITGAAHSTPLGLAGPKPRSKQHTISPESEAWVEDVMGQARRSSSTLRAQRSMTAIRSSSSVLRRMPSATLNEQSPTSNIAMNKVRGENKLRSASDIGGVSLNKRVFLRRVGKEKE
ncbi:GAS2 domain-containing protein [Nannizzia gypsea CBS 118893]|uniref:GAS2 domain-containing protein n=1 Tax=Arthroderma gypseum (strain ATCC MYA-4604 / CBS 118893) TaxID=535722 RepID=E5QYQ4_ARTGP|nr:GAS2 domain-containing protein [Nannizzia gypsea CBS 118893]EFQ97242.1 GAS2 domain-containing protein [Nannizzia gypsea CBS 118893]